MILTLAFITVKCNFKEQSYDDKESSLAIGQVWVSIDTSYSSIQYPYEKRIVYISNRWVLFIENNMLKDTIPELKFWFVVNSELKKQK